MTIEQIQWFFDFYGIDPNDLEQVKKHVLIIWMDNGGHWYNDRPDNRRKLIAFDMKVGMVIIEEMNKNHGQAVGSPFETIQKLVFKSNTDHGDPYQQKWKDIE